MAFIPAALGALGSAFGGGGLSIGSLFGAAGSIISGIAAYSAAQQQAKVAEANSKRAVERGQVEAQQQDEQTLGFLGEQEAAQSASGLSLGGRSQMLTRRSARILGRQDTLNVRNAADVDSWNYKNQASAAKAQGTVGLLSGFLNAGSSLLGSATSVQRQGRFDNWQGLRRKTV